MVRPTWCDTVRGLQIFQSVMIASGGYRHDTQDGPLHLHRLTDDYRSLTSMRSLKSALGDGLVRPRCAKTDYDVSDVGPNFNGINATLEVNSVKNVRRFGGRLAVASNKIPTLPKTHRIRGSFPAYRALPGHAPSRTMRTASGSLCTTNDVYPLRTSCMTGLI